MRKGLLVVGEEVTHFHFGYWPRYDVPRTRIEKLDGGHDKSG